MAAKSKFRIPTAKEMDKLDSSVPSVLPLFKRDDTSKSSASSSFNNGKNKLQTNNDSAKIKVSTMGPSSKKVTDTTTTSSGIESLVKKGNSDEIQTDDDKPVLRKDAILQPITKPSRANCVIVNPRQRGNPIIKHIRNIPWEFGDTPADYELGRTTCALYLSIRYHQLNPEYIHERLKKLGHSYDLRVMLVQVDVNNPHHALKELAKICILADYTLILAFNTEEAGRYLETYKVYENKPPDAVMEKTEPNFLAKFTDCISSVKSVNKTDCMTVLTKFGSFDKITKTSVADLSLCPGFGPQKAQRLYNVLHEPFLKERKRKAIDKKDTEVTEQITTTYNAVHSRSKTKK